MTELNGSWFEIRADSLCDTASIGDAFVIDDTETVRDVAKTFTSINEDIVTLGCGVVVNFDTVCN